MTSAYVDHSLACYSLDTMDYVETLQLLSTPLYHEPKVERETESDIADKDAGSDYEPVYSILMSRPEIMVENSLNKQNTQQSLFDLYNEYSSTESKTETENEPTVIPVIPVDRFEEQQANLPYIPPVIVPKYAPLAPPSPPPPSPPPDMPILLSEPVEQVPIPCSSPITKPVTVSCNEEEGILHPNLLCRGSRGKCIYYQGQWLTPNQFEYHTGRERSKYWKRSLYIDGKSLVHIMREGKLTEHDRSCTCGPMERRNEPKFFTGVSWAIITSRFLLLSLSNELISFYH